MDAHNNLLAEFKIYAVSNKIFFILKLDGTTTVSSTQ